MNFILLLRRERKGSTDMSNRHISTHSKHISTHSKHIVILIIIYDFRMSIKKELLFGVLKQTKK